MMVGGAYFTVYYPEGALKVELLIPKFSPEGVVWCGVGGGCVEISNAT